MLIGMVATVDPAVLLATLRSIERKTGPNHQVVLLPDGPAPDMLGVLARLDTCRNWEPALHSVAPHA